MSFHAQPLRAGLAALLAAFKARDQATWAHCLRVSRYAHATARGLGLDRARIAELRWGALLHDVGKLSVPEAILEKRGALTRTEYRQVCEHMIAGEHILRPLLSGYPGVLRIVRSHHERVDGSGLPDGLAGRAIPLGARIVAVADAFDAMTTTRPYRAARSRAAALTELDRAAGSQFDPYCVEGLGRGLTRSAHAGGAVAMRGNHLHIN